MMKFALVLALAAVVQGNNPEDIDLEDITAYDYLAKYGLPLAERIRAEEEAGSLNKIVGGTSAAEAQFPYQAALLARFDKGHGICGGSLISTTRVLTAAHCWYDGVHQASSFTVVLGSNTLYTGGTRMASENVVPHYAWNPSRVHNDLAIIRLPESVSISNTISPIALPSGSQLNERFAGENATASGFGLTTDGGFIGSNQTIRHVPLSVISNIICSFSFLFIIQPTHVCTSGAGGHSICQGDSGGPLIITRNEQPLLIGVTSFTSARGCQKGHPAGFTRVTSFIGWINTLM